MEATRQLLRRTIVRWLAIGFGLGLVLGLGAIFLGGNCPRTYFSTSGENRNSSFENCKNVFRFSSKNCRQDNLFRNFRNLDYRNMSSRKYFLWQFLYIKNTVEKIENNRSPRKRKVSLEGSVSRVSFVAELVFPKIPVPRLLQNTSHVNIECAEKSKCSYYLCN